VRQVRIDLQADISIFAISPVVERPELVGGALNVSLAEGFVDCLSAFSAKRDGTNVFVVIVAVRNRFFKNAPWAIIRLRIKRCAAFRVTLRSDRLGHPYCLFTHPR
jgi:hypothetical protein